MPDDSKKSSMGSPVTSSANTSLLPASTTPAFIDDPGVTRRPRDHRIDFLRGLALASIFVNHMPGNRFEGWTTRNFGFSDAAELFVLLAGVSAALAFFPRVLRGDYAGTALKTLWRAAVLYGAHLGSTLAAVAVFGTAAWLLGSSDIFELIGITPILDDPSGGVIGVITGTQQLGYFNILPLYVLLLLLAPGFLWLAARDLRLMLAVSVAVYLLAQWVPVRLPNFPTDGGWYFNPFAWQLIYAVGIALGILRLRSQAVPWHPVAGIVAGLYVAYAVVWVKGDMGGHVSLGLLPEWMDTLHKPTLPLSRLLHVLALAYLLVHSPLWPRLTRLSANNVFTRLGRNSLPVFVFGSLLSMIGYIVIESFERQAWVDLVLVVSGIAMMAALAAIIDAGYIRQMRGHVVERARTAGSQVLARLHMPKLPH